MVDILHNMALMDLVCTILDADEELIKDTIELIDKMHAIGDKCYNIGCWKEKTAAIKGILEKVLEEKEKLGGDEEMSEIKEIVFVRGGKTIGRVNVNDMLKREREHWEKVIQTFESGETEICQRCKHFKSKAIVDTPTIGGKKYTYHAGPCLKRGIWVNGYETCDLFEEDVEEGGI